VLVEGAGILHQLRVGVGNNGRACGVVSLALDATAGFKGGGQTGQLPRGLHKKNSKKLLPKET